MEKNTEKIVRPVEPEQTITIKKYAFDEIKTLLSATAGKAVLLRKTIQTGDECLCGGPMCDGAVSLLDDIEHAMYGGMDILEGKERG